ncbi:tyrosine-type recombinase/integrase [Methylobacterium radiodurans]|uniref:Tyr recombinase domain-containing protein n=1 Tax=Methylobacterium radiodurans TaxID=2202828 RepID=A0A2U8VWU4_9HYPH|nr:hypothetical protein DK427_22890 [Methylobacterium radiodurans]
MIASSSRRRTAGQRESKKLQPPAQISDSPLAHLSRWRANSQTYAVGWNGRPVGTGVEKAFAQACGDAKLVHVTPHALRHAAATWLVANGTPSRRPRTFSA